MIYYIFAGRDYYPYGGYEDFKFSCISKDEINSKVSSKIHVKSAKGKQLHQFNYGEHSFYIDDEEYDWVQIIETEDGNLSSGRDITSSYEFNKVEDN